MALLSFVGYEITNRYEFTNQMLRCEYASVCTMVDLSWWLVYTRMFTCNVVVQQAGTLTIE